MKQFHDFLLEVVSSVNIPPEERERIERLLKDNPNALSAKEILDLFKKYNEKEHKDAEWQKHSPVGGHSKKDYKKKKPIKDPFAKEK